MLYGQLQEPEEFIFLLCMLLASLILNVLDLCYKDFKAKRKRRKTILESIKREKEKDPNCVCYYRGRIY